MIKSKQEQDNAAAQYLEYQKQYNETGDREILWGPMYKYIMETARSCALKIVPKGGFSSKEGITELVEETALQIINRYIKNQQYCKELPKTMVYLTVRKLAWAGYGTVGKHESISNLDYLLNDSDYTVEYDYTDFDSDDSDD